SAFSSGSAYLSTLSRIQLWQGSPGVGLDGYQYPVLTSGTSGSSAWNFSLWWNGQTSPYDANLNTYQLSGTISTSSSTLTIAGAGTGTGTVTSNDGNLACTSTAGTTSGICAFI